MAAAVLIALKDLRLRIRDRSALIIGILAPLALAFIFNIVFGSSFDATALDLQYGVVDDDQSEVSVAFISVLEEIEADGVINLTPYASIADAETAIEAGEIGAFWHLPEGLGEAAVTQQPVAINVIGNIDAPTTTQIGTSIAEQFGEGITTAQLAVGTTIALSPVVPTAAEIGALAQEAASQGQSFQLTDFSAATRQLSGATYFAAGMAIFFLFFTVQFGVLGVLEEKHDGTIARLWAAPIPRWSVIGGKALLSLFLGLISMAVLVIGTGFMIGAEWGAPIGVALLVTAGVLAAVAIMGLVASAAKTPEGAGNLGAIIAVTLGMLGGVFFPIGRGDDLLNQLSLITPHAWFLRGLGELSDGASWSAALPAVGAMLLFALACGIGAFVLLRRTVQA